MDPDVSPLYNYLQYGTLGVIGLGSLWLWIFWIRERLSTNAPLVKSRLRIQSPIGLVDIAVMFGLFIFGQVLSVFAAAVFFDLPLQGIDMTDHRTMLTLMKAGSIAQLTLTGLAMAVIWMRYRQPGVLSWQPQCLRSDIRIGMGAFIMVIPFILLLQLVLTQLIPYEHPTMEMLANDRSLGTIFWTWFGAIVVAPIPEEIFFRGLLQNWLQRLGRQDAGSLNHPLVVVSGGFTHRPPDIEKTRVSLPNVDLDPDQPDNPYAVGTNLSTPEMHPSPAIKTVDPGGYQPQLVWQDSASFWMPILISSALFALVHLGQGPAPIPLFFFALALGYIYRRTNSILPCIALHFFLNAFSMFWFTLGQFMAN